MASNKKIKHKKIIGNCGDHKSSFLYIRSLIIKTKYLNILLESAQKYKENLSNKNLLVIYEDRIRKKNCCVEFLFLDSNFLHLTGVVFRESNIKNKKSILFFDTCLKKKLSLDDFDMRPDGTTRLKLDILSQVVSINTCATMIGEYNNAKVSLISDKICGNERASVGSILESNFYIPNTALKEDIRNIVKVANPIKAIYTKDVLDEKYSLLTKKSKDFDFENLDPLIKENIEIK